LYLSIFIECILQKKLIIKETHAYVSVIFNFSRRKISIAIFCRFTTPTPTPHPPPKIAGILFYFLPSQHQTFGGNVVGRDFADKCCRYFSPGADQATVKDRFAK
jgi:hypothetical protein